MSSKFRFASRERSGFGSSSNIKPAHQSTFYRRYWKNSLNRRTEIESNPDLRKCHFVAMEGDKGGMPDCNPINKDRTSVQKSHIKILKRPVSTDNLSKTNIKPITYEMAKPPIKSFKTTSTQTKSIILKSNEATPDITGITESAEKKKILSHPLYLAEKDTISALIIQSVQERLFNRSMRMQLKTEINKNNILQWKLETLQKQLRLQSTFKQDKEIQTVLADLEISDEDGKCNDGAADNFVNIENECIETINDSKNEQKIIIKSKENSEQIDNSFIFQEKIIPISDTCKEKSNIEKKWKSNLSLSDDITSLLNESLFLDKNFDNGNSFETNINKELNSSTGKRRSLSTPIHKMNFSELEGLPKLSYLLDEIDKGMERLNDDFQDYFQYKSLSKMLDFSLDNSSSLVNSTPLIRECKQNKLDRRTKKITLMVKKTLDAKFFKKHNFLITYRNFQKHNYSPFLPENDPKRLRKILIQVKPSSKTYDKLNLKIIPILIN